MKNIATFPFACNFFDGEQVWRSGESTLLQPMWHGFDSQTRRHMWVEFVGSLSWSERFFLGILRFSPLLKNLRLIEFDLILILMSSVLN